MNPPLTLECEVHFERQGRGSRKILETGPKPYRPAETGRIPRVSRLMALAIRCDNLIRQGVLKNYAELATLARIAHRGQTR